MVGLFGLAGAGMTFGGVVLAFFWKGEEALSPALIQWLAQRLQEARVAKPSKEWPQIFGRVFDRIFGVDALRARFILCALLASVLSVSFFFVTYVLRDPYFADSLINDPFQRAAVARQLITTSLIVNFVVDYLCLAYCREVVAQMELSPSLWRLPIYLLKDLGLKVGLFILAIGFVYTSFASGGSFGGDFRAALTAVPATLWGGLLFENLSCVYIYSSLLSSFWLWAYMLSWLTFAVAVRTPAALKALQWALPLEEHPVRSLGLVAATISTVVYWAVAGLS